MYLLSDEGDEKITFTRQFLLLENKISLNIYYLRQEP